MKERVIFIFLTLLIIFSVFSCGEQVIVNDVKGSKLEKLNEAGNQGRILIIDSRSNEEYRVRHIPNAINLPKDEIKSRMSEVFDWLEKPIYVYANNNDESFEAARILVSNGCKKVYNAEGVGQYTYKLVMYNSIRGLRFERMMAEKNTVIVDCRSKKAFKISHISGAVSVPFVKLDDNLDKIPKDKTILLYDSIGTASARAANELVIMGYAEVYASIDGVNEYPFVLVNDD